MPTVRIRSKLHALTVILARRLYILNFSISYMLLPQARATKTLISSILFEYGQCRLSTFAKGVLVNPVSFHTHGGWTRCEVL